MAYLKVIEKAIGIILPLERQAVESDNNNNANYGAFFGIIHGEIAGIGTMRMENLQII